MRFAKLMVGGLLLAGALVAPTGSAVAQDTGPLYMECLLNPPAQLVGVVSAAGLTVRGAGFDAPYEDVRLDFEGRFVGNFVGPVFSTNIPLPADATGSFTATATSIDAKPEERTCRASTTVTIPDTPCKEPCIPVTGAESLPLASFGLAGIAVGMALLLGARFRMTAGQAAQFAMVPVLDAPVPRSFSPLMRPSRSPIGSVPAPMAAASMATPVAAAPSRVIPRPAKAATPAPKPSELGPAGSSSSAFDNEMRSFLSEIKRYQK